MTHASLKPSPDSSPRSDAANGGAVAPPPSSAPERQTAVYGRVASVVAHELTNLLQILASSLDRLGPSARAADVSPDEQLLAMQTIRASMDRGTRVARQLQTFAQLAPPRLQPRELHQLMASWMADFEDAVGPHMRLELRLRHSGSVLVDAEQLQGALLNLLVNAREASAPGALIVLELSRVARVAGTSCRIAVIDHGEGMSEEVVKQASAPFYTTRPPGKGMGLGLTIARMVTEAHGGSVEIDSAPGRGTTVSLYLPLPGSHSRFATATSSYAASASTVSTSTAAPSAASTGVSQAAPAAAAAPPPSAPASASAAPGAPASSQATVSSGPFAPYGTAPAGAPGTPSSAGAPSFAGTPSAGTAPPAAPPVAAPGAESPLSMRVPVPSTTAASPAQAPAATQAGVPASETSAAPASAPPAGGSQWGAPSAATAAGAGAGAAAAPAPAAPAAPPATPTPTPAAGQQPTGAPPFGAGAAPATPGAGAGAAAAPTQPIARTPVPPTPPAPAAPSAPGAGPTSYANVPTPTPTRVAPRSSGCVLVIDDEEAIAEYFRIILTAERYDVHVVCSAHQAIERFSEDPQRYDAVLLDMMLRDGSGIELYRSFRALRPDLRVVVCTGFSDNESLAPIRADGHDILYKPCPRSEVLKAIARAVSARRTAM
jgi:CheY-like chemotaxis protein